MFLTSMCPIAFRNLSCGHQLVTTTHIKNRPSGGNTKLCLVTCYFLSAQNTTAHPIVQWCDRVNEQSRSNEEQAPPTAPESDLGSSNPSPAGGFLLERDEMMYWKRTRHRLVIFLLTIPPCFHITCA